jgi:hypothetical protein
VVLVVVELSELDEHPASKATTISTESTSAMVFFIWVSPFTKIFIISHKRQSVMWYNPTFAICLN